MSHPAKIKIYLLSIHCVIVSSFLSRDKIDTFWKLETNMAGKMLVKEIIVQNNMLPSLDLQGINIQKLR